MTLSVHSRLPLPQLEFAPSRPVPKPAALWPSPAPAREPWLDDGGLGLSEVVAYARGKPWIWPNRPLAFLTDLHADADAFVTSLLATGGVVRSGSDGALTLTDYGRRSLFVIGGDCFDKGPDNLALLRQLKAFVDAGAETRILAGNHDLRTLLGIAYAGRQDRPELAHLFVRMGRKSVPLFTQIYRTYLEGGTAVRCQPSEASLRRTLFPGAGWYDAFPQAAKGLIPKKRIEKELRRIAEKTEEFHTQCAASGMTLRMLAAAVEKARALFVEPGGEFRWYFDAMQLCHRAGSFLFVHAGVDDIVATMLRYKGVDAVNGEFRRLMARDLFQLYHGPIGNCFRTKYRKSDWPLTADGARDLWASGIYAIVHGHRSLLHGQRMMLRQGVLNFECDCSVDRNTRESERLAGPGGAATIFRPGGHILAISSDHPWVKVFDAGRVCDLITVI